MEKVNVVALFSSDFQVDAVIHQLKTTFPDIQTSQSKLEDQNWALTWQAHFKPASYGDKLWIIPAGTSFVPSENDVPVLLAPGLAFGTGNHALRHFVCVG